MTRFTPHNIIVLALFVPWFLIVMRFWWLLRKRVTAVLNEPLCHRCSTGDALVGTGPKHEHYRRASGEQICPHCQFRYSAHNYSAHRSWDDQPWLKRLCNGELVKL